MKTSLRTLSVALAAALVSPSVLAIEKLISTAICALV